MSRFARSALAWPQRRFDAVVDAETTLRRPLPVVCRVGFVALAEHAGCTTAARQVVSALVPRRDRPVLFIGASSPAPTAVRGAAVRPLAPPRWPDAIARWNAEFGDIHRRHEITVTDWGALPLPHAHEVAEHSQVVCVATPVDRVSVQSALDLAAYLERSGTPSVVVASAIARRGTWGARRMIATLPVPAALLPHDRKVGERPSASTALASAVLAATILRATMREAATEILV